MNLNKARHQTNMVTAAVSANSFSYLEKIGKTNTYRWKGLSLHLDFKELPIAMSMLKLDSNQEPLMPNQSSKPLGHAIITFYQT